MKIFKKFPRDDTCPVCHTSDQGECVLVVIDGTGHDGICEAVPVHLHCAVVTNYSRNVGVMYRRVER